jgi:hypothetical protein
MPVLHSHEIAISDKLFDEYRDNASHFFIEWLSMMVSKNKIREISGCDNPQLRETLEEIICLIYTQDTEQNTVSEIVLKDIHLLEIAIVTDNFIISNETRSRKHIIRIMRADTERLGLSPVLWTKANHNLIDWIREGCSCDTIPTSWRLCST